MKKKRYEYNFIKLNHNDKCDSIFKDLGVASNILVIILCLLLIVKIKAK